MTGQQLPVAKFRASQVSSAVWRNQIQVKGKAVTVLKATVQRRYKDKEGKSFIENPFACSHQTRPTDKAKPNVADIAMAGLC